MEEVLSLPLRDGKAMYGVLNRAGEQPAGKLIVAVHGLTGHPHEAMYEYAKRRVTAAGYDYLRLGLYGFDDNSRSLRDSTLATHVQDLADVLAHARNEMGYDKLYVTGHSYGGLAVLMLAPQDVNAVSLWDPSYYGGERNVWKCDLQRDNGVPYLNWYIDIIVGEKMIEEGLGLSLLDFEKLARENTSPTQVVNAGKGIVVAGGRVYFANLGGDKDYTCVDEADHNFRRGDTVVTLVDKTLEWFERY